MQSEQTIPVIERSPAGSEARPFRIPELLAPAGDWDCARAAVENGADAIYFGLEKFNARMRAHNFTEADLPSLIDFLHRRGVKGYVTFNTLVFENEMAEAEQYLRAIISAGVDAAIVQDVGICRLIRQLSPDFPIHVSTQMTITSAGGVEFARDLGCNLVVLARECSIKEIEKIKSAQDQTSCQLAPDSKLEPSTFNLQLPLEVFVHGALCVAYSGQCLTSEALGGRSANRGECAQACRLPYQLIADGKQVPLGDRKYLLSPQDLAGLELLPELVHAGVASLKIEGRLKSPEYVANITRIYRNALDEFGGVKGRESRVEGHQRQPASSSRPSTPDPPSYDMQMAFSRGLYTGWLRGTDNQALVHARFGKKRGVYLGKVADVRPAAVLVDLEGPLKPGDGVVFDSGNPEETEEGARVYEIQRERASRSLGTRTFLSTATRERRLGADSRQVSPRSCVLLTFGRGDINFQHIHVGDRVWKTSDPELDRRLRRSFAGTEPKFQRPLNLEVQGRAGQSLTLIARDELGHVSQANSIIPLIEAETQPLTVERLREQLGRLGGTPFRLGELGSYIEGAVMLPLAELNRLRRLVVKEIQTLRALPKRWTLQHLARSSRREEALTFLGSTNDIKSEPPHVGCYAPHETSHLIVLVRNLAQLAAAMNCGVETVYCEFEDPKKYLEAVAVFRARKSQIANRKSEIFVAPPRIFKMGEEWTLRQVRSCEADGYLVRNYDHLRLFANDRRIGDFSLNVANRLAAEYFKNCFGLERLTASYDLNFMQLEALLRAAPPEWFDVTIHQHIPMFHMEHCVFCAFLSNGTDYTNCGRPCDKHDLKLRDRVGAEHPVKADVGCRNTVFNSRAQTGAEYVSRMLALGVRHFRLEFLNESPDQVTQTISKYRQLLRGEITGPQVWRELKLLNQLGVTRGQMGEVRAT